MPNYLDVHLRDLPYFRALLRAVEARFYKDVDFIAPMLDLGCGDGHFGSVVIEHPVDVGVDLSYNALSEAKKRDKYRLLIQVDAGVMPYPDDYFGSVFSNSVLEHIPCLDKVIFETARIIKPGGLFYFCVPNHQFNENLWGVQFFNKIGLKNIAKRYMSFYDRIARHHHLDSPEKWKDRLEQTGFHIESWHHYFSPEALHVMEWGHFFSLPSLLSYKLIGRWHLIQHPINYIFIKRLLRKYYLEDIPCPEGVCTFYIARKV
jgi:SAM-dependent methyltransferase